MENGKKERLRKEKHEIKSKCKVNNSSKSMMRIYNDEIMKDYNIVDNYCLKHKRTGKYYFITETREGSVDFVLGELKQ